MAKHVHMMMLCMIAMLVIVVISTIQSGEACRLLNEEEEEIFKKTRSYKMNVNINDHILHLQALPKGDPVGPPAPNGCTSIPGSGGKRCLVKQKAIAGRHTPPQAYPHTFMPQFGVAT